MEDGAGGGGWGAGGRGARKGGWDGRRRRIEEGGREEAEREGGGGGGRQTEADRMTSRLKDIETERQGLREEGLSISGIIHGTNINGII